MSLVPVFPSLPRRAPEDADAQSLPASSATASGAVPPRMVGVDQVVVPPASGAPLASGSRVDAKRYIVAECCEYDNEQ